jgi:PLP dependent protein
MLEQMLVRNPVQNILQSIPKTVLLEAAVKKVSNEKVIMAINAGIKIIGHNYVQEAEEMKAAMNNNVQWHMIGHLQTNKVKKAVQIFDMIETIDSVKIALIVNDQCKLIDKIMHVLIEINSGEEESKTGVKPAKLLELILSLSPLKNIKVKGLMTMGPRFGDPENARPYFMATKNSFDQIKKITIPNIEMKYLSMGMSNSYKIAIEEGANIIRIGTKLFGERRDN